MSIDITKFGLVGDQIFTGKLTYREEMEREKQFCDAVLEHLELNIDRGCPEKVAIDKAFSNVMGNFINDFGYTPLNVCIVRIVNRMKNLLNEDEYILNTLCGADPTLKEKVVKLHGIWPDVSNKISFGDIEKRSQVETEVTGIADGGERLEKCTKWWREGLPPVTQEKKREEKKE